MPKPEIAEPMNVALYPKERAEILRLQRRLNYRTPMDVLRYALRGAPGVKLGQIHPPRIRK